MKRSGQGLGCEATGQAEAVQEPPAPHQPGKAAWRKLPFAQAPFPARLRVCWFPQALAALTDRGRRRRGETVHSGGGGEKKVRLEEPPQLLNLQFCVTSCHLA